MKRLMALFCVAFLVLFLTACGSSTSDTETVVDESTETSADLESDIIGTWATVVEETTDSDVTAQNDIVSITFSEDGSYVEDQYTTQDDLDNNNAELTTEGTYTIDDDTVSFVVSTVNGKTIDEFKADPGNYTESEIEELFESTTFTATIDVDLLLLENDHQTLELSRYE